MLINLLLCVLVLVGIAVVLSVILIGSSILKFVDNIKYLGIYMMAGCKFSCCYEHLKLRFYSSFNALYRRSNSSHSELVSVQLLQSFCLPVILHG